MSGTVDCNGAAKALPEIHRRAMEGAAEDVKKILRHREQDSGVNNVDERETSWGNTALHVALLYRHKETAMALVEKGASLTARNNEGYMPLSYCKDEDILEALLKGPSSNSNYDLDAIWGSDITQRNILHYVALRLHDESQGLISRLISSAHHEHLQQKDTDGFNFLQIAATEGNVAVLEALKKSLDSCKSPPKTAAIRSLFNDHQTGLLALMHNRREFFEELVKLGRMRMPVKLIVEELKKAVREAVADEASSRRRVVKMMQKKQNVVSNVNGVEFETPEMQRGSTSTSIEVENAGKLGRSEEEDLEDSEGWQEAASIEAMMDGDTVDELGRSLPTYLALYARKDLVFKLLLEWKLLTENQWDEKKKRTCLHWAVVHRRADIVAKLMTESTFADLRISPSIQDAEGKTALQMAFERKNQEVMEIMRGRAAFKEHEDKLFRDREVYVQALNAVLVGAALIGSVTFAGWLQLPVAQDTDPPIFKLLGMKVFWGSNSVSFFTAVASMCITIAALLPTPTKYVGDIASQLRVNLVLAAMLLAVSLAAVTMAFAGAGFASAYAQTQSQRSQYRRIMVYSTLAGAFACLVTLLAFMIQLFKYVPPFAEVVRQLSFLSRMPALSSIRLQFGDSSRFGYPHQPISPEFDVISLYITPSDNFATRMRHNLRSLL